MLISLAWLKKYVDIPVDTKAFVDDLTMLGLNVEHVTALGFDDVSVVEPQRGPAHRLQR